MICFSSNLKNNIKDWVLDKNGECFVSWINETIDSSLEIQENENDFWELTLFKYDKNGIIKDEIIIIESDNKEEIVDLTIDFMKNN